VTRGLPTHLLTKLCCSSSKEGEAARQSAEVERGTREGDEETVREQLASVLGELNLFVVLVGGRAATMLLIVA
jgi:hypothetical protein